MHGQNVCATHGGKAPAALRAAHRRMAERETAEMLERLEGVPINDVGELYELLGRVGGRVAAMIELTAEKVAALEDWARLDVFGREEARAAVGLYGQALDRGTRYLTAVAKLDLEAKRVRITERQIDLVEAALLAVLGHPDLALDAVRVDRAKSLLYEELATRAGGATS